MTRFALVDRSKGHVREFFDAAAAPPNPDGLEWLPFEITPFDPATQVMTGNATTQILADKVVKTLPVRAKNTTELNADMEGEFNTVADRVRRLLFDYDKRLRALEGQPARTLGEFRSYVRSLVQSPER